MGSRQAVQVAGPLGFKCGISVEDRVCSLFLSFGSWWRVWGDVVGGEDGRWMKVVFFLENPTWSLMW
jgi:hypothetical protein